MKRIRDDVFAQSPRIVGTINQEVDEIVSERASAGVRERKERLGWTEDDLAEFLDMLGLSEAEE